MKRSSIAVVGIVLAFLPMQVASADGVALQIASADGSALKDLTAQWWQWALSIPTPENPILDADGSKCVIGQRGDIWFLTGSFGAGSVTRNCTVPAGKTLFFPVINQMFFDSPNVCGQGPESVPVRDIRAIVADVIDGATDISVELDGEPVRRVQRVKSRVFEVSFPADNVFAVPCGGLPAGTYSPAVDDGYYVMLKPLSVGEHTLHFHAEQPEVGGVIDNTYNLTVVPVTTR